MKNMKTHGAGFVVVSPDLRKVLMLRKDGTGDLPKGSIEEGESSLQAAIREVNEEAGITISDTSILSSKPFVEGGIAIYVAVQSGKPKILPNPKTGVIEHDWVGWVPWHIALRETPIYLRPGIMHARALCATLKSEKERQDVNIP
jgi:8-oxo-dGTP pyrophosphatase MutT (NUDIX family)